MASILWKKRPAQGLMPNSLAMWIHSEGARLVVHPHGEEGGQPLHDEGLACRPDDAAPDQVVETVDRPLDRVGHPVVGAPLHRAAQAVGRSPPGRAGSRSWPGRSTSAGQGDAGQGHAAGADRFAGLVTLGDVVHLGRRSALAPGGSRPSQRRGRCRPAIGILHVDVEVCRR